MAEDLKITATTKNERYQELIPQFTALLDNNRLANMANLCAALKYGLNFFWVGFYLVEENQLVLGPFQGPVACSRIAFGKGVCGTAWQKQETIIVDNVEQFPGHIACSSLSKSEIVIPIFDSKKHIIAVLDVDSDTYNSFDTDDEKYLKQLLQLIQF